MRTPTGPREWVEAFLQTHKHRPIRADDLRVGDLYRFPTPLSWFNLAREVRKNENGTVTVDAQYEGVRGGVVRVVTYRPGKKLMLVRREGLEPWAPAGSNPTTNPSPPDSPRSIKNDTNHMEEHN